MKCTIWQIIKLHVEYTYGCNSIECDVVGVAFIIGNECGSNPLYGNLVTFIFISVAFGLIYLKNCTHNWVNGGHRILSASVILLKGKCDKKFENESIVHVTAIKIMNTLFIHIHAIVWNQLY